MRFTSFSLVLGCLLGLLLSGCTASEGEAPAGTPTVVATIGMIADVAETIGGEHVKVIGLMGPGVDPHLYKPTAGDVQRLSSADCILYNGLHLEGKMGDVLVKMSSGRPVIRVTETVSEEKLREPPEFEGQYDPHLWFDVSLWIKAAEVIRDTFKKLRPDRAEAFEKNADAYLKKLEKLHTWVQEEIAKIPEERRVLITAHDAFGYFGRAYGMEVVGLQGISTSTDYGLQDVQKMVDLIVSRKIKAVFIESSVSPRAINAVVEGCKSKGFEVKIGGELFSDAMGKPGTPEGTYLGMVRHNVETIVGALK